MLRVILAMLVLAAAALAAQTVEGLVVNSVTGAGVPGAAVSLIQGGKSAYSAITDSQGRFRIEGVNPGLYTAEYDARSFWRTPHPLNRTGQPPFLVTTAREPVHLDGKLYPVGKLSGRVLDASGEPVPNAGIWLHWEINLCKLPFCVDFKRQSKTGTQGEFSITDLNAPGAWWVSATAPASWPEPKSPDDQRLTWGQTFYPGVTDSHLASELIVRPGSEFTNLEIKLAAVPVRRVRGTVVDTRGDPVPKVSVILGKNFGPSLRKETKGDGTFEFEFGAAAGEEWYLSATMDKDRIKLWAAQGIKVKDRDLEDIELRTTLPFSIQGKIVAEVREGMPAPKLPRVIILYAGAGQLAENRPGVGFITSPDAQGDFTVRNLYAAPYSIAPLEPPPPPYYLDSIRLGELDALGPDLPTVSEGQRLTVTYKLGGGTVRGTIEACAGGDVFLVPQDSALRRVFGRRTTCAQNGQFEFLGVRPGEYYGYAIAGDGSISLQDVGAGDSLYRQASKITVRANESTSAEIRTIRR